MATDLTGYTFSFGNIEYSGTKDGTPDGAPFTLLDCWRNVHGVAAAVIYSPTGRVVLRDAGSTSARWKHIDAARGRRRSANWHLSALGRQIAGLR